MIYTGRIYCLETRWLSGALLAVARSSLEAGCLPDSPAQLGAAESQVSSSTRSPDYLFPWIVETSGVGLSCHGVLIDPRKQIVRRPRATRHL